MAIEVITAERIEREASLADASRVAASLASLRFVLFDRKSPPCTPGLHAVLVQVAGEFRDRARFVRSLAAPGGEA